MRRVIAPLAALMLLLVFPAVSPGASPRPESRARAWAVKVAMAGDTLQVVQMAEVASQSGASMAATGAPLSIGGQDLVRASASQTARDDVKTQMNYTDSTGSTTFEGGFAEAHVSESSSTSRAGFGSNVTSGLPMASMLMTWEQQEQAMNTWISLNEPIFGPLNAQMEALAPVLERQGLVPPHFEYLQPLGFVDVVKSRQVAATSETVSTEGYSSASASVTLSEIRLFAGFIEARGVSAEASSEGTDAAGSKSATARIEGLKIAGIDCVADSKGVHAANNDALAKAMIQPTLDAIVGALRSAGVTLRAIDSYGEKDL
ncbi:MAG: choice-of-anchor P family protein, partial [Actinomycetota bacterium]